MDKQITNPVKAIGAYCLNCVGGVRQEVRLCPCTQCELYAFRNGENPYRKKKQLSESARNNLQKNFKEE